MVKEIKTIKTIKVDYWSHQKLSEKIILMIQNSIDKNESVYELNCVPNMKKPYFWEFWKWGAYRKECDRIMESVRSIFNNFK